MKSKLFLIAIITLLFSSHIYANNWIKTKGNKFVDSNGKEIIFRGLCYSDPDKLERDGRWNDGYFAEAKKWGANIVRFAIHPKMVRDRGWDEYFKLMDRGVELAKKHDLYVIMDWHSIGNLKEEKFTRDIYVTTKEETFKFWAETAKRYKDEPVVAMYELFNEPTISGKELGTCTWVEWKELQEKMIDIIRENNPNALCLAAGFDWAYDLTPVGDAPIARENIAYVSHPYPQKREEPWQEKWEADFGYVAKKYPVICTEIGFCLETERGAHIPVISTVRYGEQITKYFEERGISFTIWCFDPNWPSTLFTDWNYTPSAQGVFFKDYLQKKAASTK